MTRQPTFRFVMPRLADPVPCVALTLAEAGRACGVSAATLRAHIEQGALQAKRTTEKRGGRTLVTPAALRAWFDQLPDA